MCVYIYVYMGEYNPLPIAERDEKRSQRTKREISDNSIIRSFDKSIIRQFDKSTNRSFDHSTNRSFDHSTNRSFDHSTNRSFDHSTIRHSIIRSFESTVRPCDHKKYQWHERPCVRAF